MRLIALIAVLAAATPAATQEIAPLMLRLQTHMDKLYWAGQAQNWPLAAHYAGKLGETLDTITKAKIVNDGVNVSALAGPMLSASLKNLEKAVADKKDFKAAYTATIGSCNGCHAAAQRAFIKIKIPTRPIFDNQDYTP